jgi:hypothetical protein
MLKALKALNKAELLSPQNERIGRVVDFYFDDAAWVIRYLVVNLGSTLNKDLRLVAPESVERIDWQEQQIFTMLTPEMVKDGLEVHEAQPISKLEEEKLAEYYGWSMYWAYGAPSTIAIYPGELMQSMELQGEMEDNEHYQELMEKIKHSHLRSYKEVMGYRMHAEDDSFGEVEDFLMSEDTFQIGYLVVDTVRNFPSKSVVISPGWIDEINWADKEFRTFLSKDAIQRAPQHWQDVEGWIPGIKELLDKREARG